MQIKSKAQMYRMLKAGIFGNTVRSWNSYEEMMGDSYNGDVGGRFLTPGKKFPLYCGSKEEMSLLIEENKWQNRRDIEFCESPPDCYRTIQGELWRTWMGLYFRYTLESGPMRIALERAESHSVGITTNSILSRYIEPEEIDRLHELMDCFHDPVVEFTAYSRGVGTLNRSVLIWEVRHY